MIVWKRSTSLITGEESWYPKFVDTPIIRIFNDFDWWKSFVSKYSWWIYKNRTSLQEKIQNNENTENSIIAEVNAINGFLNFKLNKKAITQEVINEFDNEKENFGAKKQENPKNIVIDYSSPNIAKPFHIGHLRSTVIGGALYNIYKYLGYNVTGINHLGDYGTQFGKLIEGYKRWSDEYNIEENPIDELTKIYIRIKV